MRASTALLALLPAVVSAHFTVVYPPDRGDDDATQATSPCGGKDTPSSSRAKWPLSGGSQVAIEATHPQSKMAVYLGLGNNPKAEDFTIVVKDVFMQIGIGEFCWNDLVFPSNLKVKEGDNATIQIVQQSEDTAGGLYNCADITFTNAAVSVKSCKNGTGISAEAISSAASSSAAPSATNMNGMNMSPTTSSPSASSTTHKSSGTALRVAGGAFVAGVVGVAAWML